MSTTSAAAIALPGPRIYRRFWVFVVLLLIVNALGWMVYDRVQSARHRGVLRVERFEPGENATLDARSTVRWHFSEDVIPTTAYGKEPGKVTPAVAGRWAWEDPRTLSFVPAVDFPRAMPVSFSLATDLLRSGTGAAMNQPFVSSVHSRPLSLVSVRQASAVDNDRFVLELRFNDRVSPGDVLAHASAKLTNGHHVGLAVHGQAAGEVVRLITDSVALSESKDDTELVVKLLPGLTGLGGPLGLTDEANTVVTLGRSLAATDLHPFLPRQDRPFLQLSFNKEIEISALKKVLTIEPAIDFTIEASGSDAVNLHGDFQSATRYTAKIAALPTGAAAAEKAKSPRPGQVSAFVPDRQSDLWFDNDQGYLSSAGNRTLMAHVVNVSRLRVSVTRMYDNNLVQWRNATANRSWVNIDSFIKPVATRVIATRDVKNLQQNLPIDLDDLLPANIDHAGVWRVSLSMMKPGIKAGGAEGSVEAGADDSDEDSGDYGYGHSAVVTLSDIGLTAKKTRQGLVAWATSLHTAQPMANVRIRAYSNKNQLLGESITGGDGLATLAELHPAKDEIIGVILADVIPPPSVGPTTQPSAAADLTWLDLRHTAWELGDSDISGSAYLRKGHEAFVYTDRGVYRPGEVLHLRAIVRSPGEVAPKTAFPVKWQLHRPDLRDWKSEVVMLDADGAAALDIALPTDLPSGQWSASLGLPGEGKTSEFGQVSFLVEDFMPNRLKTSLSFQVGSGKDPKRYSISDTPLDVEVQGDYLFGRPASGLAVELMSHAVPTAFHPAGWEGWSFGDTARIANVAKSSDGKNENGKTTAIKKSSRARRGKAKPAQVNLASDEQAADATVLDEHGSYRGSLNVADLVHLPEESANKLDHYMGPWTLSTEAGVREAGGRAVSTAKQIAIDALPAYIGVRMGDGQATSNSGLSKPGETTEFQIKMVLPDGAPANQSTENQSEREVQAYLLKETWNSSMEFRDGHYHYNSTRVLNQVSKTTLHLSNGQGNWSVRIADSGNYAVRFVDAATGACTSMAFYCTSGTGWDENVDRANPERLQLRVLGVGEDVDEVGNPSAGKSASNNKSSSNRWHVGDTARVLISSPFKGRLLLSIETDDVVQSQVIEMTASHMVVPVKVTDECWPNAFITATVIRGIDPDAPKWQTHRALGITRLNVDSTDRRLQMTLSAPELIRPLQSMDVGIKVTDPAGNAVSNAAITLAAVDEGICSLTDFKTPDPLKFFSSKRALGVESADLFGLLMPEVAKPQGHKEVGGDTAGADTGRYHSPVGARRVKPVALAWAEVHTDPDGIAKASFSLPQFQGKLRVIAVGYTDKLLGSADRAVTVRSPILAQSSWPRFAAPGDSFSVPVVLFNNSGVGGDVLVSASLLPDERTPAGLIQLGSQSAKPTASTLDLPPIPIAAGGQQQVNFDVAVAQKVGVAKVRLFVSMGDEHFSEIVEFPIRPASPRTQSGGVMRVSTTQPMTLTATTNMMPGTDALRVSITPWPSLNLPAGLDYLDRYPYGCVEQTTSTCFPLLALGDIGKQIDPVAFDPARIKDKIDAGITRLIGLQTSDGGLGMWSGQSDPWAWGSIYAAHFLTEAKSAGYEVPADFYTHLLGYVHHQLDTGTDDPGLLETQAYAAYVLALAGKPERAVMDRLTELCSASPMLNEASDCYAMRSDARLMLSCAWLLSGRRDLAEGLLPDAAPIPRTKRQLGGNLGSPIRDRALLILAMQQIEPNRAELPDLVQQLADEGIKNRWNSTQDVAFSCLAIGRYLREAHAKSPYDSAKLLLGDKLLAEAGQAGSISWTANADQLRSTQKLNVQLTGKPDAVGHLSWLQTGVPLSAPAEASHGLSIHRRYLLLDDTEIHGSVHTGDLVRVELTLDAPPCQDNLVIEDLLPAGLEVENPRLETASKAPQETDETKTIPTFGGGNLDVQDDRVVIVGSMPNAGTARCSYLARAITPGTYTVSPVRAEAMYDLNTNAISGSGKLTVLAINKNLAAAD